MARRSDDDDAPWLAEATSPRAPARTDVSKRSLYGTVLLVLGLAAVVAIGLILLISKKDGGSAQGYMNAEQAPVITAEAGPYKIKPADPAGMAIEGLDGTMYTAGEGIDTGSAIDPSLAPEAPLPRPGSGVPDDLIPPDASDVAVTPPPATGTVPAAPLNPAAQKPGPAAPVTTSVIKPPAVISPAGKPPVVKLPVAKPPVAKPLVVIPATAPTVATPEPTMAKPTPAPSATKSGSVQLGAFSSEEKASAAWAGLAGKQGLSGKRIIAVESGGKTLYRLRATATDPVAACSRIKAAGDACAIVE